MNVIAPRTLRAFWDKHPHAETPLREWQKDVQRGEYRNFTELRAAFSSADYLATAELTILTSAATGTAWSRLFATAPKPS